MCVHGLGYQQINNMYFMLEVWRLENLQAQSLVIIPLFLDMVFRWSLDGVFGWFTWLKMENKK